MNFPTICIRWGLAHCPPRGGGRQGRNPVAAKTGSLRLEFPSWLRCPGSETPSSRVGSGWLRQSPKSTTPPAGTQTHGAQDGPQAQPLPGPLPPRRRGHRNTPSPPSTGRLARRPPLLSLLPRDGDTDPEGGRTRAHLACCAGPGPELTWPSWARGGRGQTPGRAEADVKPTSPGSPPGRSLWVAGSCLGSPCQCQQELFLQSDAPSPDSQPISEGRGREQGQKAGPLLPKASSGLDPGLTFCPHPAQSLQFLQPPARSSSGSVRAIMRIPVTAELQQAARPHPS